MNSDISEIDETIVEFYLSYLYAMANLLYNIYNPV